MTYNFGIKDNFEQGGILDSPFNDLPSLVSSSPTMFADDAKLYRTIRNQTDTTALQHDLNIGT